MKKALPVLSILFILLFAFSNMALAVKVPTLSYATPQTYTKGTAITPLTPTSTGIAAPGFSTTATAVGSGFAHPHAIAFDHAGNVYVAELNTNAVKKMPAGGGAPVIIGTGFSSPQSLAVDAAGNVYVVDETRSVKIIPAGGGAVTVFSSAFDAPSSVTIDGKGNIYITDSGAIKVFPPGSTSWFYLGNQLFGNPIDVAVDGAGNVFVADYGSGGVIREYHAFDGSVTVLYSGFDNLVSIDVDAADNVFVADAGNNVVDELPAGSSTLIPIGSGFSGPAAVNLDAAGNAYVADYNNNAVKIIKPVGGCFISPLLPPGLSFNNSNGVITGTPSVLSPATNYTVTAYNAGGSKAAMVSIAVTQPASDATLSALAITSGTLSPAFASGKVSYSAAVSNSVSSIKIKPTVHITGATVKVNGTAVASGTLSAAINLVVGPNIITTTVTSQDGTTQQTYTVTVTRAASPNADLAHLVLSNGTFSPVFNADTINYTTSVGNTTTGLTVKPTAAVAGATITVNSTAVVSGNNSPNIPLVVGINVIPIIVTAPNGTTTKTYTLSIIRAGASVASLKALKISNGTLAPVFKVATLNYVASVGNGLASMTVTPTTTDANATVKVNGTAVVSGSASAPIALSVGANNIAITVTSQDGINTNTYNLIVTKAGSSVAALKSLSISSGTLAPEFATATFDYSTSVKHSISTIKVKPVTVDANATVKVNGVSVLSGNTSPSISLATGINTINTVVTAQNGTNIKTYTIQITRSPQADDLNLPVTNNLDANTTPDSAKISVSNSFALTQGPSVLVKVYPNPATSIFNLQITNGDQKNRATIMVRNLQGKVVYQKTGGVFDAYTFGQNFAAGIYIAQITNGKFIKQLKLIKSFN